MESKLKEYKAALQQTEEQLQQLALQQQRLLGAIAAVNELQALEKEEDGDEQQQ